MIKELHIENWKSFEKGLLYIDPLTVIIGTNASGKSNVLDALLFLQRVASGLTFNTAVNGEKSLESIRGGADWLMFHNRETATIKVVAEDDAGKYEYEYELSIRKKNADIELLKESLTRFALSPETREKQEEKTIFKAGGSKDPFLMAAFLSNNSKNGVEIGIAHIDRTASLLAHSAFFKIQEDVLESCQFMLSLLKKIFVADPIPSQMRGFSRLSGELLGDAANIAGVLAALAPGRKEEVEKTLAKYLQKIPENDIQRVWTETVGHFKTDAMLYCEEGWEGQEKFVMDLRGMSDGTLRLLGIIAALLTVQPGSLLVIDEIDKSLHPSRAKDLLEMLKQLGKERGVDVICTTHNPALLDALGNEMVPFISVAHRDDKGASCITLIEDIENLPKMMASGTIGVLSTRGKIEKALSRHPHILKS